MKFVIIKTHKESIGIRLSRWTMHVIPSY